jgi:hypothetical protein
MNRPDPGYSIHEGVFDRTAMLEVLAKPILSA